MSLDNSDFPMSLESSSDLVFHLWFYSFPCILYMETIAAFHDFATDEERGIHRLMFCTLVPYSIPCGVTGLNCSLRKDWSFLGWEPANCQWALSCFSHDLIILLACLGPTGPSWRPVGSIFHPPFPKPAKLLYILSMAADLTNMLSIRLIIVITNQM